MRRGSWVLGALIALTACGRLGFDDRNIGFADGGPDAAADAGIDAQLQEMVLSGTALIEDAPLEEFVENENCGECAVLNGGNAEATLFRFDVTGVVGTPTSARLEIWLRNLFTPGGAVDVFVVTEQWVEGTENGADGVANWNQRLPGVAWTSPGVGPDSREEQPFDTVVPVSLDEVITIDVPPSLIAKWRSDPGDNFGIVLKGRDYPGAGSDHPHFYSTEEDMMDDRSPRLVVTTAQ